MGRDRWGKLGWVGALLTAIVAGTGCGEEPTSRSSATAPARYALGMPAPYQTQSLDLAELETAMVAQRQAGWSIAQHLWTEVTVRPASSAGDLLRLQMPRFATWYTADEVEQIFLAAYANFSSDERRLRRHFTAQEIAQAMRAQQSRLFGLPGWDEVRWDEYLSRQVAPRGGKNLLGLPRVLYSRQLVEHALANYNRLSQCVRQPNPDPVISPPPDNFTTCFTSEMPDGAVAIKLAWRRADEAIQVPSTSAAGLAGLFSLASWEEAVAPQNPTAALPFIGLNTAGEEFYLVGMHFMTKELRKWFWGTLWWDADHANEDFGADRVTGGPDALRPYKLCTVVSDRDASDLGDLPESLAAAYAAVRAAAGGYSWCSNPHLELGQHNHVTNCIGCHQHAGTNLASAEILADPEQFPEFSRQETRDNFPADYVFSMRLGNEQLGQRIAGVIDYFDGHDPDSTRVVLSTIR